MERIYVPVEPAGWHNISGERLWAQRAEAGLYEIRNIPMYARGLSFGDLIQASINESGILVYNHVIKISGHSTYRILLLPDKKKSDFYEFWIPLESLGCTFDSNIEEDIFAVDVPPEVNIFSAFNLLEDGVDHDVWEFEEAHCGHQVKND